MDTKEAIANIARNHSVSEDSLIISLHERDTFSPKLFWDLYDSIGAIVNASLYNDELTEQISWCYQSVLKLFVCHFSSHDLYIMKDCPYDYDEYLDCLDYAVLAYYRKNPNIIKHTESYITTKRFIDRLDKRSIPWNRMFTAYGTADNYCKLLSELEQTLDVEQWTKVFNRLSDFEHQSTMFPPAPFVMVFLVRMLQGLLWNGNADGIVHKLLGQFLYYASLYHDAKEMDHAEPLPRFADLLDDENLLPENYTEDDLQRIYEDPEAVSDQLFYSYYHYSAIVLSQVPDMLDYCDEFPEESDELRRILAL